MRYFRSPLKKKGKDYVAETDPKATFLGDAQWKWLEEQLKVPAEVRLLCSSIELVAEDHPFEKWANFPLERDRLFKLIKDTKASGLIVLSGDRHLAELSLMDAGIGYPLYDLTSSGINQAHKGPWRPLETNRHRVATMNAGDNFGLVVIEWDRDEPRVRLQALDVEGDVTIQEKVPLKTLQPGSLAPKGADLAKLTTGEPLTPAEAAKHVGQEVTVELTVQSTGSSSGGLVFLNSAKDFKSEDNFTVVLEKEAVEAMKKDGTDPKDAFKGKLLHVTGKVTLYRERPEIKVDDPKQIEVVKK
jgi:alkaline phosphatase D